MSVTADGLNAVAKYIEGYIATGRYTMNGVTADIPVYSTKLEGNVLKVFLLFDNTYSGTLTQVQLIGSDGKVFDSEPESIVKIDTKLLLATFRYTITSSLEV